MTGTWLLLRTFLRRDRWQYLWWSLGGALLYWSQAYSVDGLYQTQADFDRAAETMGNNLAFIAMIGPARALNTIGGQVTWQATAFGAIVAGLMSMFLVGRHTRAEEESGRDELIRSQGVGRLAPMTAALVNALLANVAFGALVALSLVGYPLAVADSVALGVGVTLCGWLFTGTALMAAQMTASTRGMYGLAGSVIGLAYALRAVGDVGTPWLSWLSPIGWYQAMHPFSGLRWWPALLVAAGAAGAVVAAYALFGRRDFAAGVIADRPGPERAGPALRGSLGLAWRLQRGSVIGWTAGLFVGGLMFGSFGDDMTDLMGDSALSRDMFLQGMKNAVDGFYAASIVMLALIASGFAVSSALRPRGEENEGRVEALLATGVRRRDWLLGHVTVTVLGTLALLLATGFGLGVGFALVAGGPGDLTRFLAPTLTYVAPVLVLSGFARLLVGVAPQRASLAWLPLVLGSVVMLFGDLLKLPQWFQDLSPFEHLALVPAESFRWAPFLTVLAVALLLSVAGQVAFARRDIR